MERTPEELKTITAQTLAYYDKNAQGFWEGTRDHDVSQNINVMLKYIEAASPLELLDFGCGPGRDLISFKALGHRVTGLEGSAHLALIPGGVLFCSNPRGEGQEGWNGERYGAFHDWQSWRNYVTSAGFMELTHYYRPAGLPREQQPWLASVWRKVAR